MRPFDEKLVHAQARDALKIVDAFGRCILPLNLWMRSSVIGGNKMERAHGQAGGNRGETRLLSGFQDTHASDK